MALTFGCRRSFVRQRRGIARGSSRASSSSRPRPLRRLARLCDDGPAMTFSIRSQQVPPEYLNPFKCSPEKKELCVRACLLTGSCGERATNLFASAAAAAAASSICAPKLAAFMPDDSLFSAGSQLSHWCDNTPVQLFTHRRTVGAYRNPLSGSIVLRDYLSSKER